MTHERHPAEQPDEVAGHRDDSWFMRGAAAVGDLNSPFYAEERQRDVWNEASAVGFQLTLWLGLIAANAMIWIGAAAGRPYALTTVVITVIAGSVVLAYAERLGVQGDQPQRMRRGPLVPYYGLLVLFCVGMLRTYEWTGPWFDRHGFWGGFQDGAMFGARIATVALLFVFAWQIVKVLRDEPRRTGSSMA